MGGMTVNSINCVILQINFRCTCGFQDKTKDAHEKKNPEYDGECEWIENPQPRLRLGDIITSVVGIQVENYFHVWQLIGNHTRNGAVKLGLMFSTRGGFKTTCSWWPWDKAKPYVLLKSMIGFQNS